ncbi:Chromo and Ankyrin domain containing protein [Sesbania bispinosa]|nr:Chromo and Ankyrin domain containing protein [Sesbania bispinosa]
MKNDSKAINNGACNCVLQWPPTNIVRENGVKPLNHDWEAEVDFGDESKAFLEERGNACGDKVRDLTSQF